MSLAPSLDPTSPNVRRVMICLQGNFSTKKLTAGGPSGPSRRLFFQRAQSPQSGGEHFSFFRIVDAVNVEEVTSHGRVRT